MKLVVTLLSIFSLTAYAAANRKIDAGTVEFKQQATPSTPASGYNRVYAKPDGKVYNLTSAGVEAELGAGGGGGAKNYIQNPNAATDATTGVTYTNVTAGRDSSGGLFEDTNFSFTIDSATDVVSFAADAFDPYLQNTGLCQAEFTWTADANGENVQAQVFRNGAVIGQKNLYTTGATSPATASIAFLCGDLVNATTFRIVGTAATTTALKLSQVKLTEASWSKDPVGSTWVGGITWPGAASCEWSRDNTSFGDLPVDSDCTLPSGANVRGGGVSAPLTKYPHAPVTNMKVGSVYKITASGSIGGPSAAQCAFRFSNGTDIAPAGFITAGSTTTIPSIHGYMVATVSGAQNISIQAANNTSAGCRITNTFTSSSLNIDVEEIPQNQAVVNLKAQSGDFGPTNFAMTITGTTSNPTKGANTEVAKYSRTASFMGINYSLNQTGAGASGSGCYLFSVPGGESVDTNQVFASTSSFNGVIGTAKISNSTGSAQRKFGTVHVYDATRLWVAIQTTATDVDCLGSSNAPLLDSAQLISFEVPRLPIKNWTKSNTAVNIAGEPGVWNGKHDYTCVWGRSSTTVGPYGATATCGFSQLQNVNFGTVVSQRSGSDYLPGIVFTPKLTGAFMACPTGHVSTNGEGTIRLLANSVEVWSLGANSTSYTPVGKCGSFAAVVGTPVTLEIQGASTSGSSFISGLGSGTTNRSASIEWTIFPITQNLPGVFGGGGGQSVYTARIANAGSGCTATEEQINGVAGDWFGTITSPAAAKCTIPHTLGVIPKCNITAESGGRGASHDQAPTSSNIFVNTWNNGNDSDTPVNFTIVCFK
jgi:hypothetical protein